MVGDSGFEVLSPKVGDSSFELLSPKVGDSHPTDPAPSGQQGGCLKKVQSFINNINIKYYIILQLIYIIQGMQTPGLFKTGNSI